MPTVWKIAPGEHAEDWDLFREHGCIGLGWLELPDFGNFGSEAEVLSALEQEYGKNKKGCGAGAAQMIWQFVDEIKPSDDIVVANEGYNRAVGIGLVKSAYLSPESRLNPIRDDETTHRRHVRLVNWIIKKPVDLPGNRFFVQPTLWRLKAAKVEELKHAYLTTYANDSEVKEQLEQLFGSVTQDDSTLAEDLHEIAARNVDATTRDALVSARIGQGRFRADVLQLWDNRCAVTKSVTQDVIRASHIKPWRDSTDEERLDPYNGLPLVASLDALFDVGLISFDSSGKMLISSKLNEAERHILGIGNGSLAKKPTRKTVAYLAHHRANRFK